VAGGVKYNPKNGGKLLAPPLFHAHALEILKSEANFQIFLDGNKNHQNKRNNIDISQSEA